MCCVSDLASQQNAEAVASGRAKNTEEAHRNEGAGFFALGINRYLVCNLFVFLVFRCLSFRLIHQDN